MCGITGIVDLQGRRPIDAEVLRRMNSSIAHRGPDGDGFHIEPGVGFGHRRLSIIDLEGGKQPLYNEDHTVVVTYNGEIYNFKELEIELRGRGHIFRTRCDTEVIVHAWEEWGEGCVERFNGMFAFAIWDRNTQTLFLARDRLGVKPLYYVVLASGELVFGSELKALIAHPGVPRQIDPEAVEEFFAFGYVPDPKTIFVGLRKLEPGTFLKLERGRRVVEPVRYWDIPLFQSATAMQEADASNELIRRLENAVTSRLVSDVPLGAFLSGGIDSSAVVAMMRKGDVGDLLTCSIGFHEAEYDESQYAQRVADEKHTHHKTEMVSAGDYELLDKLVSIYDEPFADSSAIPTYRVCQLARRHVTVALSGDGGDENFIGYRRYRLFALEDRLRKALPEGVRKRFFGPLGRHFPKLDWAPRFVRGKTTFEALARSAPEAYLNGVTVCADALRSQLFSVRFRARLQGYSAYNVFERHLRDKHFDDSLRMAQYLDFKTYLPGDILTKVDRASMANSLEVRGPFLDYQFSEWIASVPTDLKLHRGHAKYILKKSLEAHLPKEVLYRTKMGFAVPLDIWFRGALLERMSATVTGQRIKDSGIFDAEQLDRLVLEHREGRRNHSAILWSLLMFDGFLAAEIGCA